MFRADEQPSQETWSRDAVVSLGLATRLRTLFGQEILGLIPQIVGDNSQVLEMSRLERRVSRNLMRIVLVTEPLRFGCSVSPVPAVARIQ